MLIPALNRFRIPSARNGVCSAAIGHAEHDDGFNCAIRDHMLQCMRDFRQDGQAYEGICEPERQVKVRMHPGKPVHIVQACFSVCRHGTTVFGGPDVCRNGGME